MDDVKIEQGEAANSNVNAEETRDSFAQMFETEGSVPGKSLKIGEKVSCKVTKIGEESVFVSYGGKSDGVIGKDEFATGDEKSDSPKLPAEGDEIQAYILARRDGEVVLSTRLTRRDQSKAAVEDAFAAGLPVEGRVVKTIKGGFEVRISGLRAFCPISQMDTRWPKDPEVHVGQIYSFKISEYKENGRNIIVSRRSILEEEKVTRLEELKKKIVVGNVVTGRVRNVQNFGAFVELDGVDGLIPVSEMSWSRIADPKEMITEGQTVTAKIISTDWEKERISLSLRALESDPWLAAAEKYEVGKRVRGTVARLTEFGAFVNLEPGIDGMIHVSALGSETKVKHPREALSIGDEVEAEVTLVDKDKKRISLSMEYKLTEGFGALPALNDMLIVTVQNATDFGLFAKLPSGHLGVIPNTEMPRKDAEGSKTLRPGDEVEVRVIEVSKNGKKIRLSIRAAEKEKDRLARKEFEAFKGDDTASFGTFADLLKKRK